MALLKPEELFKKFEKTKFWKKYAKGLNIVSVSAAGSRAIGYETEGFSDYEYSIIVTNRNVKAINEYTYYDENDDKVYYITIIIESIDMLCNEYTYNYKLNSYCAWYVTKAPALKVFIKDKYDKIVDFFNNIETKKKMLSLMVKYFKEEQGLDDIIEAGSFLPTLKPKVYYHLFYLYNDIYGGIDKDFIMAVKNAGRTYKYSKVFFKQPEYNETLINVLKKITDIEPTSKKEFFKSIKELAW